ncbi:MAG: hypothetical protein ACI4SO_04525, partial [Muribaculaceae bacterium]
GGNDEDGKPYYIPGYGSTSSNIAAAFSIYYTLPLWTNKKHRAPKNVATDSSLQNNANSTPSQRENATKTDAPQRNMDTENNNGTHSETPAQ